MSNNNCSIVRRNVSNPSFLDKDEFLTPFSSFFEDIFNNSFPELYSNLGTDFFGKGSYPKVDVKDEENRVIIEAEVPGLSKDQISIEVNNNTLRIKGEKQESDASNKNISYLHRELKRSSFCRTFSLGDNIDKEKIDAKFNNGILEISLNKIRPSPKKEEIKKIEIK